MLRRLTEKVQQGNLHVEEIVLRRLTEKVQQVNLHFEEIERTGATR